MNQKKDLKWRNKTLAITCPLSHGKCKETCRLWDGELCLFEKFLKSNSKP